MGHIQVLNQQGDQTIEWDPSDERSVAQAEGAFNALRQEGYAFYETETKTQTVKGKAVKSFKKSLGKLIAAPAVSGSGTKAMRGGPPEERAA